MSRSKWRGHSIEFVNEIWLYSDNKKPVSEDKNRSCGNCGRPQTIEGHDGCIGTISCVMNACCGHGNKNEAYIQYENGERISGEEALKIIKNKKVKCNRCNDSKKIDEPCHCSIPGHCQYCGDSFRIIGDCPDCINQEKPND